MRNNYWHTRMEKWGIWNLGVRGIQVSPIFRVMNGVPRNPNFDGTPRDYSEEIETNDLVKMLPEKLRAFAARAYPGKFRLAKELGIEEKTVRDTKELIHRAMARMLDQRRRGEPIDPTARRPRPRTSMVKINNRRAAAVCE